MPCTGRYATAEQYRAFWCIAESLSASEQATIEMYLDIAASDLHSALAASNQCSCAWAPWANGFAAKLNIIDAAIYHQCPCARPELSPEQKTAFLMWMNEQLSMIRTSKLDLCQGSTGAEFPAMAWGRQALTSWAVAQTYLDYLARFGI